MKNLIKYFSVLLSSLSHLVGNEPWTHLELGAGNYGLDGHTKHALRKVFLKKITLLSDRKNFIDDLEERATTTFKPEDQYGILFWTLDQLILKHGSHGIFHINDICEDYARDATEKLQEYALNRGYHATLIECLPGDYQSFDCKRSLSNYGKLKYDSVHLKHPELSFYHDRMDGDICFSSENSRRKARELLQTLANLSHQGLYFFIHDSEDFIPQEEKREFIEKNTFYLPTTEWEPAAYMLPEGRIPPGYTTLKENARVFFIKAADPAPHPQ